MNEQKFHDVPPPSADYLEAPGCEVILASPQDNPITATRAAAILMRLAGQRPDVLVDFWVKIRN